MTIVNDNSGIIIKWSIKVIDAARGIIFDCHMFIVQATGEKIFFKRIGSAYNIDVYGFDIIFILF